jgi:hypothetical protein
MNKSLIFIISLFIAICSVSAQEPQVGVSADSSQAFIGSRVNIKLDVKSNGCSQFIFPQIPDSIPNAIIIYKSNIDSSGQGASKNYKQTIIISSVDSGYVTLPSLTYFYSNGGGNLAPGYTKSVSILFKFPDVSKMKDLNPISPIIREKAQWTDYWIYYVIGIAVLIISYLAYRYFKKKKPLETISAEVRRMPRIFAEKMFEADLAELEQKRLWLQDKKKEHYTLLSDSMRRYIEIRLNIQAVECVSEEIKTSLANAKFGEELRKAIIEVLDESDLVKFAKYQPDNLICENSINKARSIIEYTREYLKTIKDTEN